MVCFISNNQALAVLLQRTILEMCQGTCLAAVDCGARQHSLCQQYEQVNMHGHMPKHADTLYPVVNEHEGVSSYQWL
jgi:hypothetical protein